MPHRIEPRTEVHPDFTGPNFLTSSLPPSSRPGHRPCRVEDDDRPRRSLRRFVPKVALVAGGAAVPGVVDVVVTGAPVSGLAVSAAAAVGIGVAALVI